ncbi:MAG TPA: BBE domain-containing protein [Rubrobacteraceae bacterium]|nr:BBE domain-containing protein [Rubrobacteraceae bacterium]
MAIGGRGAAHTVYAFAMWEDPVETDAHVGWARGLVEAMGPYTVPGVSLNVPTDQDESRARSFFRGGKYERLAALKEKYDPDNLFRLNQNIKPSTNGKGS